MHVSLVYEFLYKILFLISAHKHYASGFSIFATTSHISISVLNKMRTSLQMFCWFEKPWSELAVTAFVQVIGIIIK